MIQYHTDESYRSKIEDDSLLWVTSTQGAYREMIKGKTLGEGPFFTPALFFAGAKRTIEVPAREVEFIPCSYVANAVPVVDLALVPSRWEQLFIINGGIKGSELHNQHMTEWEAKAKLKDNYLQIRERILGCDIEKLTKTHVTVMGENYPHYFRVLSHLTRQIPNNDLYFRLAMHGISQPNDNCMIYEFESQLVLPRLERETYPELFQIGKSLVKDPVQDSRSRVCIIMREILKREKFSWEQMAESRDLDAYVRKYMDILFPSGFDIDRSLDHIGEEWSFERDMLRLPFFLIYSYIRGNRPYGKYRIEECPMYVLQFLVETYKLNTLIFDSYSSHFLEEGKSHRKVYQEFLYRLTEYAERHETFYHRMYPCKTAERELSYCFYFKDIPSDIWSVLMTYFRPWSSLVENPSATVLGNSKSTFSALRRNPIEFGLTFWDTYPLTSTFGFSIQVLNTNYVTINIPGHLTLLLEEGSVQILQEDRGRSRVRLIQPFSLKIFQDLEYIGTLEYIEHRTRQDYEADIFNFYGYISYRYRGEKVDMGFESLRDYSDDIEEDVDWCENFVRVD